MRNIITSIAVCLSIGSFAQIPSGYYSSAQGLTGEQLRTALFNIIDNHTIQSYASLWNHFKKTDNTPTGIVWDMYSMDSVLNATYYYQHNTDQCGNYVGEGSCYNREHSFPKSWFGNQAPMNSDLFHMYPTDGYVNNRRNNFPYGYVSTATWNATNGSKLGTDYYSNYGYAGSVFEPIDEYKGDFARTYFYMLTRYKTSISGWSSDMLSGSDFSPWAENVLLEWHHMDSVSAKEIARNDSVYTIQNNRNPFIDHPHWVDSIWQMNAIQVDSLVDTTGSSSIIENELSKINIWVSGNTISINREVNEKAEVYIFNSLGQIKSKFTLSGLEDSHQINLPKGIYVCTYFSEKRKKSTRVFID